MFIIYGLKDPYTNEIKYIGRSSSGLERPKQHWYKHYLKRDKNYDKANWIRNLLKNNIKPIIEILYTAKTKEELLEKEKYYIAQYRKLGNIFNILEGGIDSPDTSVPVIRLNPRTGELKEYSSCAATIVDGFHPGHVASCCCGTENSHKKHYWWHKGEEPKLSGIIGKAKPIIATRLKDNKEFFIYTSSDIIWMNQSRLSFRCLRNENFKGYNWKYATEEEIKKWLFKIKEPIEICEEYKFYKKHERGFKQPYIGINIQTNEKIILKTVTEAKNLGFHTNKINSAAIGKCSQYKGYKWYKLNNFEGET